MVKNIKSKAEFDDALETAGSRPVLVDFYAPWCGPCKEIAPKLTQMANKYTNVTVLKVNVDKCDDISVKYSIRSMPTFKVFKNGRVVCSFTGADYSRLKEVMEKYNAK